MAQAVVTAGQFDGDLAATGSRSSTRPELGLRIEDQGKTRSVVLDIAQPRIDERRHLAS